MNTLNISVLNTRANAEGLSFAAVKAAIHKAGESLKTRGFAYGPFEVALADLPRHNGLYRNMVLRAAPGVQPWEEITSPFPEAAWPEVYQLHIHSKWRDMQNGTQFVIEIEYKTWWGRKLDNEHIVVDKIYCQAQKGWEEEQILFLPPGIRAATAAIVGADPASSTFHSVFDAIVDGTAIY